MPSSLQESIATKLNSGIVRLASVREYPKLQRRKVIGNQFRKGRVFRVGALHRKPLTEQALLRNRRGYVNAQLNTVAHAPSLFHWLFHRCGIPFEETQALIQKEGIVVNGSVIRDTADAEVQLGWAEWQKMEVLVRSENSQLTEGDGALSKSNPLTTTGVMVPALQRALHRRYYIQYIHPGVSISSDVADPKSFVHRLSSLMAPSETLGLNMLRPMGFMNGMRGLGIATNDVALLRYWNNDSLGNYGVYDIRFRKGIPKDVVNGAQTHLQEALDMVQLQLPPAMRRPTEGPGIPCSCSIERVPPLSRDPVRSNDGGGRPSASLQRMSSFSDEFRLLASTPLLPYREARHLRRLGGHVTLVRSGPFVLPGDLAKIGQRALTMDELLLMFAFERKLKVNRMMLSLREFDDEEEISTKDMPY